MPRLRKSVQKHLLAGTEPQWSDGAMQFAAGRPKMPPDLSPVGESEWKRITKELRKRGTLTKVDSSALEVYCRLYSQWRALCAEVEERGPMIDEEVFGKDGEKITRRVQNPAQKLAIQLGNALRMYQKEFSATPASREKAKPAAPEPPKQKLAPGDDPDPLMP
jgi:P27 family predicted phage terminase small subunit